MAARKAVEKAAPFPPPPVGVSVPCPIDINLEFNLTN
jgi:outer membrane biosynthesis protein TonB